MDYRRKKVVLDSSAFEPENSPEDESALELLRLYEEDAVYLLITPSFMRKAANPKKAKKKKKAAVKDPGKNKGLSELELAMLKKIEVLFSGSAKAENAKRKARHILNCYKNGGCFVTTDKDALSKSKQLLKLCGVEVYKPSEMLGIIKSSST